MAISRTILMDPSAPEDNVSLEEPNTQIYVTNVWFTDVCSPKNMEEKMME